MGGLWKLVTAALSFDLFVFPLLLWRRTRLVAFCAAVVFHLINAKLFEIGVFPWLAIAATALFLSAELAASPRWNDPKAGSAYHC